MSQGKERDPFAGLFGAYSERLRDDRWRPSIDVFETEKEIRVRVELAGVPRDRIRVNVQGSELRIRGDRRPAAEGEIQRHHQMEIAFGPFERTLHIGVPFERDRVVARLDEGFLTITLPKRVPTRVPVEVKDAEGR